MSKHFSHQEKRRLHTYLIWRDGNKCIYCKKSFRNSREPIIEHLNNDRSDNRRDNLAYAHQKCNVLKGTQNDGKFLEIGLLKLEENELHNYVGESFLEKEPKKDASTEIEINHKCYEITEQYLTDKILEKVWIPYKGVIHNISFLAIQKTGHGSVQSIRSHLMILTSDDAPFEIMNDEKEGKIIRRRKF